MSTLEKLLGGKFKIGNTTYKLVEIKDGANGNIIWPLNLTYVIVANTIALHYSSGTKILANASNYAYVTATVQVYRGTTLVETRANERMSITTISDTTHFEIRDGNTVYAKNIDPNNPTKGMGAIEFLNGLTCDITNYGYSGVSVTTNPLTVEQQANTKTPTGTTDVTTAFEFTISSNQFYHTGGTISIYGTQTYNVKTAYSWTSGATSEETTSTGNTRSHNPDTLLVTPTPQSIASDKSSVTFAANNGSSDITYQIMASLDGKGGTAKSVKVLAAIYAYSNLQILLYGYSLIPASGGQEYANSIPFSIDYSLDGVAQGTLSGAVASGATTATASHNGHSVTVNVVYMRKVNGSWVLDSGRGLVSATTRGYNEDSGNTTDTVTYPERKVGLSLGSLTAEASTTVYQQRNYKYEKSGSRSQTSYSVWLSTDSVSAEQNTIYVYGRAYYSFLWAWVSEAPDTQGSDYSDVYPTAISTSPDVGSQNINISRHSVTIPANTSGSARSFRITGSYGGYSDYADVDQEAIAYTYGTPRVSIEYDTIGAAGGTLYPTINFTQDKYQGSTKVGTITGQLSNGATSGTASDGSSFSLTQISGSSVNGTFSTSSAGVTIGSRGTTEGSERVAARYIYVKLKCHDLTGDSYDTDGYVSCNQAENYKGSYIDPVYTSVRIVSLSKTSVNTCAETAVTASVKATWTDGGYKYSAFYDGDTSAYTGLAQHNDEAVTGTNGVTMRLNSTTDFSNSTNEFKVSNLHNTSSKTHSVVAMFGDKTSSASSVTQAADSQSDWLTRDYLVSVSIASNGVNAAGGTATVSASASHTKYKKWLSDNTEVSGTASSVTDTPTLSLVDMSSSGAFSLSGTTVTHRYMDNAETTDSVKVKATNGSATATTSAITATNSKSYGNISMSYTGSQYIAASGGAVPFSAECPISWTSGRTGDKLTTLDFTWSFYSKGNNGKRTYTFSDGTNQKVATFGSLGTNSVSSDKDTVIRASYTGAGYAEKTLVERKNIITGKTLTVNWNITGLPSSGKMSGMGGTLTIKVSSASLQSTYSSGATSSPTSVTGTTILNNTTASGTGFTFTHAQNTSTSTLKAVYNSSTSSTRDCVLTVSYSDATTTLTITQDHINHEVSTPTTSGNIVGNIKNTDASNAHSFTYYVTYDGNVIVPTDYPTHTDVTANWNAGASRAVCSPQPASGHILQVIVTAEDGYTRVT